MKVIALKDWGSYKKGDTIEMEKTTAKACIAHGVVGSKGDKSKTETFDETKSKAKGMSVEKVKAHLATLETVEEVDAFIDPQEDRDGVKTAVTERKAELTEGE